MVDLRALTTPSARMVRITMTNQSQSQSRLLGLFYLLRLRSSCICWHIRHMASSFILLYLQPAPMPLVVISFCSVLFHVLYVM